MPPEETKVDPAAVEAGAAGYAAVREQVNGMRAQVPALRQFDAGSFEAAVNLNNAVDTMANTLDGILVSVGAMSDDLTRGVVRSAQILSDADEQNDRLATQPYSDMDRRHTPGLRD